LQFYWFLENCNSWSKAAMRKYVLSMLIALSFTSVPCSGQTLWTEGGEHGLASVIDGTSPSYPLLQSDVVYDGQFAFHLANPDFEDNWFVLDRDITAATDTKLFFQSRLSWATPGQVAKVQVSTDGGSTWPVDVYTQTGTGDGGEGAFMLREIDLGSYADESLRFRFYYDHTGGSAFTSTDTFVGWRIDDIQVGSQLEKLQYSVGNPSDHEQLYLEYINRARADAVMEAERLATETNPDITSAYRFFDIDPQDIVEQFQWSVSNGVIDQVAQPLSFNENLLNAAQWHSEDMFANQFQGHVSVNPPTPLMPGDTLGNRANTAGYQYNSLGENVYAYSDSVLAGHAGFDVDWGNSSNPAHPDYNPDFVGQGMQNPAGHRANIHNNSFKEIGIGVINGTNGSVGPQIVTQDFGRSGTTTFITGVVFEDLNGNDFYDLGEGRQGVRVDVDESSYFAVSSPSGAYSIPVTGDGSYLVDFAGGGFANYSTQAFVEGGRNVKVDYLVTTETFLAADFNTNGVVDLPDYVLWKETYGSTTDLRADGNGDSVVDFADYTVWRDSLGAASTASASVTQVPEPPAGWCVLLIAFVLPLALVRRRHAGCAVTARVPALRLAC
jgi:hypothetical protein